MATISAKTMRWSAAEWPALLAAGTRARPSPSSGQDGAERGPQVVCPVGLGKRTRSRWAAGSDARHSRWRRGTARRGSARRSATGSIRSPATLTSRMATSKASAPTLASASSMRRALATTWQPKLLQHVLEGEQDQRLVLDDEHARAGQGQVDLHQRQQAGHIGPLRDPNGSARHGPFAPAMYRHLLSKCQVPFQPSGGPSRRKSSAAFDEHPARSVVGPERCGGTESRERILEAAGAVGARGRPATGQGSRHAAAAASISPIGSWISCSSVVPAATMRSIWRHTKRSAVAPRDLAAGQDLGVVHLVQAFQPRRLVRHRADQRVVDVLARADIADHRQAGMQAKARAKARTAELAPFLGKLPAGGGGLQGRAAGVDDMVGIGLRRVPEGHDAVADVLVDRAVVGQDRRSQRIEIARQPAGQQLRLHGLADPREAFDVGEHHRDLAPPAADARGLGRAHDLVHEVLRHVAAEHLQPLAHALDRNRTIARSR